MITSRMNKTRIAPVEVNGLYPPTFSLMLTPPLHLNTDKICENGQAGLGEKALNAAHSLHWKG
jgi:hypothetical protein